MSLRDQVLTDLRSILRNESDFGQAITLTDPSGATTAMIGLTKDISRAIDADTGVLVKGRTITVTVPIADLPAGARPEATHDTTVKPWLVSFPRITSAVVTGYAVIGTDPDDSVGGFVLELGNWNA